MGEEMVPVHRAGERRQLRKLRPGGWTKEKKQVFLRHLAATANVSASVKAVGMSKSGVEKLRAREPAFAQAWEDALLASQEALANHVMATSLGTAGQPDYDEEEIAAGRYPEAPDPKSADPQMALEFLKQLNGKKGKRLGRAPRMASKAETAQEIMARIDRVRARAQRKAAGAKAGAEEGAA